MTRTRLTRTVQVVTLAAAATLLAGGAYAAGDSAAPGGQHGGREPANLGQVKLDIEDYYGDVEDADGHHHASPDSDWARQAARQVDRARRDVRHALDRHVANPAVVLDVDDTSELTYGFNADHDFGYDAAKAEEAINNGEYPAIESTLRFAQWAADRGVEVYFVTGRPEHQRAATLKNLANEGYPEPAEAYLKPEGTAPDWLPCGLECTTVEYKSGTRAHIEDADQVTIVLNMGDQYSDLDGGHARHTVKLPNPMYYLP